jgi:cystathionine beta-synthase
MRDNGLLDPEEVRVGDLMRQKKAGLPALVTVEAEANLRRALELIRAHNISQIPVVDGGGAVVGTVHEGTLLTRLLDGECSPEQPVAAVLEPPLPRLPSEAPVSEAVRILASRGPAAVLIEDQGSVAGLLSRFDLIGFVAR